MTSISNTTQNRSMESGRYEKCVSGCKVSSKPMSLYKYHPTRSAKVVEEVLGEYNGYLQTDGYEAYAHAWKATRIGCWAHARRKWIDCLPKGIKTKGSKAEQALSIVEEIFTVEKYPIN